MKKIKIIILVFTLAIITMWLHAKYWVNWDESKVNKEFQNLWRPQVIYAHYLGGFGMHIWDESQREIRFMYDGKINLGAIDYETENNFEPTEDDMKFICHLIERSSSKFKYQDLVRLRGYPIDYIRYYLFATPFLFFIAFPLIIVTIIKLKRKRTNGST